MAKACRLSREQMLEVVHARRRKGVVRRLARKFRVNEDLIRHVRYRCTWLRLESTFDMLMARPSDDREDSRRS